MPCIGQQGRAVVWVPDGCSTRCSRGNALPPGRPANRKSGAARGIVESDHMFPGESIPGERAKSTDQTASASCGKALTMVVSELRTEKLISGTLDAEILLSFVRRLLVSMPSRLQVDQGKLVVVLRARPFLPWQSEAGDNSVIHQRQSRNGRLSRSFRSRTSDRSVV